MPAAVLSESASYTADIPPWILLRSLVVVFRLQPPNQEGMIHALLACKHKVSATGMKFECLLSHFAGKSSTFWALRLMEYFGASVLVSEIVAGLQGQAKVSVRFQKMTSD